jgi:hypothetical protein
VGALCILLCLFFGAASIAIHFFVNGRQFIGVEVDARGIMVLMASLSLLSFVLALWFALAEAARGLA